MPSTPSTRLMLRAARILRREWLAAAKHAQGQRMRSVKRLMDTCRSLRLEQRKLARVLGWLPPGMRLPGLYDGVLAELRSVQDGAKQACSQLVQPEPVVPELSPLIADLRQLDEEFEGFAINLRGRVISATTEAITLKNVRLGRFRIELHWARMAEATGSHCFDVVALDPNPAARDDSVTHPHVKDQSLCAGEAMSPIKAALEQGRLADAFMLVRSVLRTYNSASPHIALKHWADTLCHDCECSLGEDEGSYCDACDHTYCTDCSESCHHCEATRCSECLSLCSVCDERCCSGCLSTPPESERRCCPSCLRKCTRCGTSTPKDELSEAGLCSDCQETPAARDSDFQPPTQEDPNAASQRDAVALASA